MAKEMTLEELYNNTAGVKAEEAKTVQAPEEPTITEEEVKAAETFRPTANSNIAGGQAVDPSTLASHMRAVHGVENTGSGPVVNDAKGIAPVIDNAFKAMDKELASRKEKIENELMPIIEKNAEEMAAAKELGVDPDKIRLDSEEAKIAMGETPNADDIDLDPVETVIEQPSNDFDLDSYETDDTYTGTTHNDDINIETEYATPDEEPMKDPTPAPKPIQSEEKVHIDAASNSSGDDLDSFLNELEEADKEIDIEEEETQEEMRARLKESLDGIVITKDPINLGQFKIRKEAISTSNALSSINATNSSLKRADWPLYFTGRNMTFVECRGPELDTLRKTIQNSNGINSVIASLRFIYNHTIDANKPKFETWCKLIRTEDYESLCYGMYRACYADSNMVARSCPSNGGCGKQSLVTCNIDDMVKFADDEAKEAFKKLKAKDSTTEITKTKATLMQISDDIVISYTMPTLYTTFIQYAALKDDVADKYADTLEMMTYIDGFFRIDRNNMELIPIAVREYENNLNKTVITKLKAFTGILKTLSNDQYSDFQAKMQSIQEEPKISYILPKTTCPECGHELDEEPVDNMFGLLFTRAQLVQLKSL